MSKRFIRKITKKGQYSYYVILPKSLIDVLNWQKKQKIVLERFGKNRILISDWSFQKQKDSE